MSFKLSKPSPPATPDEQEAKVLQHLQMKTREGIAVTAPQLLLLGLSHQQVQRALSFWLHCDVATVGILILRDSTGKWVEHYHAPANGFDVWSDATPHAARRDAHTAPAWPFPKGRDH